MSPELRHSSKSRSIALTASLYVVLDLWPLAITIILSGLIVVAWGSAFEAWARSIRDKEYLVETRIRNMDELMPHLIPVAEAETP